MQVSELLFSALATRGCHQSQQLPKDKTLQVLKRVRIQLSWCEKKDTCLFSEFHAVHPRLLPSIPERPAGQELWRRGWEPEGYLTEIYSMGRQWIYTVPWMSLWVLRTCLGCSSQSPTQFSKTIFLWQWYIISWSIATCDWRRRYTSEAEGFCLQISRTRQEESWKSSFCNSTHIFHLKYTHKLRSLDQNE